MKVIKKFFKILFVLIAILAIAFAALVVYVMLTENKLPDDVRAFDEAEMERQIDAAWRGGEEQLLLRYAPEGTSMSDLEPRLSDYLNRLSEHNPRYWYEVRNASYTISDYTDYLELSLSFQYNDREISYDELPKAATRQEALSFLAPILEQGGTSFTFLAANGWTTDDLNSLASELLTNSVELAAESNTYHYYFVQGELDPYDYVSIEAEYRMDQELLRERSLEMREALNALAAEIAAQGGDSRAQYLAAARAVAARANYDDDARIASYTEDLSDEQKSTRSAYGAVVTGRTVCTGYAMAYKALCDRLGLPCWIVGGYNGDGGHAWNMICLDGETLYMDCTFADAAGSEDYYFMTEDDLADGGYYYSVNQLCPWAA